MKHFILIIALLGAFSTAIADIPDGPGDAAFTTTPVGQIGGLALGAYSGVATFVLASFLNGFEMRRSLSAGLAAGLTVGITTRVLLSKETLDKAKSVAINDHKLILGHRFLE